MRNYFIFDGQSSLDYGVYISGDRTFSAPERDISAVSVPGRSGDLLFDNGRYRNMDITYKCGIVRNFDTNLTGFRNMLLSRKTYARLEDTYHPDVFWLAYVADAIAPAMLRNLRAGEFDITFNRKPQQFLKSGENPVVIGSIFNPTLFEAMPLMRVYGTGTMTINGTVMTVTGSQAYMDIDFETQNAYSGSTNLNGRLTVTGYAFPKLMPGQNTIVLSGLSGTMIPRWYTL